MFGNKMMEGVCIVRMNNSKVNIAGMVQRVPVCGDKRISMYNSIRKIVISKELRSSK